MAADETHVSAGFTLFIFVLKDVVSELVNPGSCHVIRAPVGKQWLYGGEIDRNDEYDDVEQEGLPRHSGRDSGSRYTATTAGSAFADTL